MPLEKTSRSSLVLAKIQQHSKDALYIENRAKKHQKQLARKLKRDEKKRNLKGTIQIATEAAGINDPQVKMATNPLPLSVSRQNRLPPKNTVEEVEYLHLEHMRDSNSTSLHYSAKELKLLYGWETAPKIPKQNKEGGQCAFQAHTNLMWSITSIGPNHKYGDVNMIRSKMRASVDTINKEMLDGNIPTDRWNSQHLFAGDEKLHQFSVHAFMHLGGSLNPFRYHMMTNKGGSCLGLHWLLRQSSGYFIVYGNRYGEEDIGKKKFLDSFHYLAVNIEKRVVIDNKASKSFLRLCAEAFTERMKTVHTILRFEKLEQKVWKVAF